MAMRETPTMSLKNAESSAFLSLSATITERGEFEASFADGLDLSELVTDRKGHGTTNPIDRVVALVSPKQPKKVTSASEELLRTKEIEQRARELQEQDAKQLQNALMEQVTTRELKQLQRQIESTSTFEGDTMLPGASNNSNNVSKAPRTLNSSLSTILGAMHTTDDNGAMRESKKRERHQHDNDRNSNSNNIDCDVTMGGTSTNVSSFTGRHGAVTKALLLSHPMKTPKNSPCATSYRFFGHTKNEHHCKIELSKVKQRILERNGTALGLYKKHQNATPRRAICSAGGNSKNVHVVRRSRSRAKH